MTVVSGIHSAPLASALAVLAVFGVLRFYMLHASALLHNLMDDSSRASVLAALSVLSRVVLVVVLPMSGFAIEHFGIWFLPFFGSVLAGALFVAGIVGRMFGVRFDRDEFHLTQS